MCQGSFFMFTKFSNFQVFKFSKHSWFPAFVWHSDIFIKYVFLVRHKIDWVWTPLDLFFLHFYMICLLHVSPLQVYELMFFWNRADLEEYTLWHMELQTVEFGSNSLIWLKFNSYKVYGHWAVSVPLCASNSGTTFKLWLPTR